MYRGRRTRPKQSTHAVHTSSATAGRSRGADDATVRNPKSNVCDTKRKKQRHKHTNKIPPFCGKETDEKNKAMDRETRERDTLSISPLGLHVDAA